MNSPSVSDYLFLDLIGVGSNATVFLAVRKDNPEEILAIKCINVSKISKSTIEKIVEASNVLKSLEHENIVKLKEFFIHGSRMYFVLEYCDGGSFSDYQMSLLKSQQILQQLASALQYLHSHNIFHMNLKPKNILIATKPFVTLKVGDYGFAQYLSNNEYKLNLHGSPLYKAPEILLDKQFDNRVDLWSIGVIMYEWIFRKSPYFGLIPELTDKIKKCHQIEVIIPLYAKIFLIPQIPRISNACKNLLTSLLQHNLEYRLKFEDFFSDEFLDLEHMPCEKNFIKAQKLLQNASELEFEKKSKEAFDLYSNVLKYLVPMLTNKKKDIKLCIHDLIYRMEEIRSELRDDNSVNISTSPKELTKPPIHYNMIPKRLSPILKGTMKYLYRKLRKLSEPLPEMCEALELGESGVYYLSEGNYARAKELLQRALNELKPILRNEPSSIRRNLLTHQVDFWNRLLIAADSHFTTTDIYTTLAVKSREFCVIQ
ncbi:PREDICTED: serine/threonine-protein kinase ULK3 [Polistes canadensis]|uniref:serine/threonine-protein kinase ULK3 n=1 Tax=Polistes canadensis TaxID=91411 RepID=UPI000718C313|nr:PREDICTED: serine/threonine-protein kinase ULK3 [Polistes canadensis]